MLLTIVPPLRIAHQPLERCDAGVVDEYIKSSGARFATAAILCATDWRSATLQCGTVVQLGRTRSYIAFAARHRRCRAAPLISRRQESAWPATSPMSRAAPVTSGRLGEDAIMGPVM